MLDISFDKRIFSTLNAFLEKSLIIRLENNVL